MHAEVARRRAYLHLCRWTSLGLSLIEAMQMGMPVLALATTEAVAAVPPDAGVLVHPRRHPGRGRAVADRRARTQARRLGARARQVALARYGLDRFLADWDRLVGGGDMRIAMISEHASPLAALGGADAGGQNTHVAELSAALAGAGPRGARLHPPGRPGPARRWCRWTSGVEVVHVPAGPADGAAQGRPAAVHGRRSAEWLAADWRDAAGRRTWRTPTSG